MGWILVVAVRAEGGHRCGTVREGGVCFKSIWVEVRIGLERATDTEPVVAVNEGTVVILEGITGTAEEGLVVTVQAGDTVTGALHSPAAELKKGLQEVEVCRFKLLTDSNLADGG